MKTLSPHARVSLFVAVVIALVALLLLVMRVQAPTRSLEDVRNTISTVASSTQAFIPSFSVGDGSPDGKPGVARIRPPGFICGERNAICIAESYQRMTVENPLSVTGTAIAFENTLQWRIEDQPGRTVDRGTITYSSQDVGSPGEFALREFFFHPPTGSVTGTLTFFTYSAKDGSEQDRLTIPVQFQPFKVTRANVYLRPQSATTDCSKVEAWEVGFPKTLIPTEATLRRLLAIQPEEKFGTRSKPLVSVLPAGVELRSLVVNKGTATATFSSALQDGVSDSCRVTAIRAQIERTMKQFSGVIRVVIRVEGLPEGKELQP